MGGRELRADQGQWHVGELTKREKCCKDFYKSHQRRHRWKSLKVRPPKEVSASKRQGAELQSLVSCSERALHSKGRLAGNGFKQRKLSRLVQRI